MKIAVIKIKGTKPFLYHRFNIETLTDTKKPKQGSTGNNPYEWKETIWEEDQRLYIPAIYLHSGITAGGKYIKVGRGTISKNVGSALTILDDKIYFNYKLPDKLEKLENENMSKDSSQNLFLDIRAVSNPMTKGKNVRYRLGLGHGWELEFKIEWDDSIISRDQMKGCIEAFGKLVGLSDGRSLGFGRFELLEFKIL